MRTIPRTFVPIVVLAFASIGFAQDRGRDDHRDGDRGRNDQHDRNRSRDETRDTRSQRSMPERAHHEDFRPLEGTHNNYHSGGSSVSISILTPGLDFRFGDRNTSVQFRSGYYHYDPRWRDDRFLFRFYAFDFDRDREVFSPFYYYPSMPGYFLSASIDPRIDRISFRYDQRINFSRGGSFDRVDPAVRDAVYDLQDGIEKVDRNAIGRLIPTNYWVNVDSGIGRPYRMRSDNFYNVLNDMAATSRSSEYRLLNLETGFNCARASFEHDFVDAWGHRQASFHRVTFDGAGRNYRIVKFESSRRAY